MCLPDRGTNNHLKVWSNPAPRCDGQIVRQFNSMLDWLKRYELAWLRGDVVAGLTLAAYLLPAGLGDASLANLPPEAGLYACLFSGLVFWLFCSSRYTAITVTSAIAMLVGSSLGAIAGGDTTRFGALAAGTALLVAAIAFIAWLAKVGSIVNFISESVMVGFKCGVALFLASTQLPKLFGIHGAHGDFWENSGYFLTHLHETNPASLTIGGVALAVLVLGKIFLPHKPVALLVVVGGITVSELFGFDARGVTLLGAVPQGLPDFGVPAVHWADLNDLLPLALACFLLGAVETAAIGRTFAAKHGGRLDANQEFLALAASNLAAGLGRGFPVSGGMSQSLVNEGGGARTPLSGAIAAGIMLVVVLFLSHLLAALPQPVLAAVVLVAVTGLFKVSTLKQLRHANRTEYLVAMSALLGVLCSGLLRGVLIGAIISLVLLIRSASRPHVALLGRIPGTRRFSDRERHPENELIPGVLIFRPESSLFYFNMDHVRDTISDRVRAETTPPKLVVLDLSAAPHVDMHGAPARGTRRRTRRGRGPLTGCRNAVIRARPFAPRRGGRQAWSDRPVHLRGRRRGGIPQKLIDDHCFVARSDSSRRPCPFPDRLTSFPSGDRSWPSLSWCCSRLKRATGSASSEVGVPRTKKRRRLARSSGRCWGCWGSYWRSHLDWRRRVLMPAGRSSSRKPTPSEQRILRRSAPRWPRAKIRKLLGEYADERLEVVKSRDIERLLVRSNELHRDLWTEAELVGKAQPNSIVVGLFYSGPE